MRVVNELEQLEQAAARDDMSPLRHLQRRPEFRVSIGQELLPNPILPNRTVGSVDDLPLSNPDKPPLFADDNTEVDGFEPSSLDEPAVEPSGRERDDSFAGAGTAPSSNPHRPRDRPKARMAWMSDWSSGPPGLLGGRFGACFDRMHTAVTEDVSHDPATGGIPAGSQTAGTPGPVGLVQPHGDSPFCLCEHIVNRLMSDSGPAESQFSMLATPLDDARASGESEPYAPKRQSMTELLADIVRLSEAAQSADSDAGVPAEVDWEELEPLLRMLNVPRTLD